ncbi:MAG: S46 family peptidase [Bacteroidaceae bacterium]
MGRRTFCSSVLGWIWLALWAGEGMWLPDALSPGLRRLMQEMGLAVPYEHIWNGGRQPALCDAVVSFGGFCSGVVVSADGLLFTNHHCGFDAIRQQSTVEHDYVRDGFVARSRSEELPCPDLYVSFLVRSADVSARISEAVRTAADEVARVQMVDSVSLVLMDECRRQDSLLRYEVVPFYGGSAYRLLAYRDYTDIRLAFAPPASVGKFGWDTDNWMWPRHTGDFAVFRIYADRENHPADYAPDNVPYRAASFAPVSLAGYEAGSFCMTLGYPGSTDRYLSSFGVQERMEAENEARIRVRGVKQQIWREAMDRDEALHLQYASKYASSSNYWKNSLGMNKAVHERRVVEHRQERERQLMRWIQQRPDERRAYLHVLTDLQLAYRNRRQAARTHAYFTECFLDAPELVQLALRVINLDADADSASLAAYVEGVERQYADFDVEVDKAVMAAMLDLYREATDEAALLPFYQTIDCDYQGDSRAYVEALYGRSALVTPEALRRIRQGDASFSLFDDPAATLALDLLVAYFDLRQQLDQSEPAVRQGERLLGEALRRMDESGEAYPDANSTMRLSFGIVQGYAPRDGVRYNYRTTVRGIAEKVRTHAGDADFAVEADLLALLGRADFGRYANAEGGMNVCFISDNDITGGNSGSGMFNAKGELIGLAFDGNWEAMSADFRYEPTCQRCIGVDIRYVLYLIETYGKASHLISELGL